jgi:hypothetical protein
MTAVLTLSSTTANLPFDAGDTVDWDIVGDVGDAEAATEVLISPVFRHGAAQRRRLLRRCGCVVAALCLAYLVMLGVSITAVPVWHIPLDINTTHGVPGARPATGRRHQAVAAEARLPTPRIAVPDVDDRDLAAAARPASTPAPTRTTHSPPTPPTTPRRAHPTQQRTVTTSTATTSRVPTSPVSLTPAVKRVHRG